MSLDDNKSVNSQEPQGIPNFSETTNLDDVEPEQLEPTLVEETQPLEKEDVILEKTTRDVIETIKESSRKIALPTKTSEEKKLTFHEVFVKNMENRATNGEGTINNSIILLFLMIIRFSPELLTGEKIYDLYGKEIAMYTGWNSVQYIIAFPYWPAAACGYAFSLVFGLVALFLVMPAVPIVKSMSDEGKNSFYVVSMKVLWYFTHPMYMMTLFIAILTMSHALFIVAILQKVETLAIIARVIFGFSDSMHLCYHTYFIMFRFGKSNFALAFGFLTSVKAMTYMIERTLPRLMSMQSYLILGLIMCIISCCATLSLPNADMDTTSIFRLEDRDAKWTDKVETTTTRTIPQQILDVLGFTAMHQTLNFVLFLLYMFPFYYGGVVWNSKYHSNTTDHIPLEFLQDCVYYSRAIFSPAIGALLDTENHEIDLGNRKGVLWVLELLKKTKINFAILITGMVGVIITQYLYFHGEIHGFSQYFYVVSFLLGFAFALSQTTLLTFPMLFFHNTRPDYLCLAYATYKSVSYFIYISACTINIYVINSEQILNPIWYACTSYLLLLLATFVCGLIGLLVYKKYFLGRPEIAEESTFQPVEKKEITMVSKWDRPPVKKTSWWWLFFYVPLEAVVLFFALAVLFVGSGFSSIILTYSFAIDHDPVRIYLLPTITLLCVISMRLAFPDVLRKFLLTLFFKHTRAILGWIDLPTIATKLSSSPQFSIACEAVERNYQLWETLNMSQLDPEPILIVVPDEIVLKNEADRFELYEKNQIQGYEDMDVWECSNGMLVVDTRGERNIFDYAKSMKTQDRLYSGKFVDFKFFTEYFFFLVFVVYCGFIALPIVVKLGHKWSCATCVIPFFDDDILSITSSIRFIFGFFILIPFVGLWQEINRILERLHRMDMIFKAHTINMLTFKTPEEYEKLTIEQLQLWDISYAHLQNMHMCKGIFLRYIFMFSVLFSKLFSVVFSVAALFVKFGLTPTIFQLTLLVIAMEIALMRYILQVILENLTF
jgi:hypothetical protein